MRSTRRLLAIVKSEKFLTPGNPTGLTGLLTHPAPRSQLVYLYSSTLNKLAQLPEYSVYRKSAEAITKQRLSIIQGTKPPGYEQWEQRAKTKIEQHPEVFGKDVDPSSIFVSASLNEEADDSYTSWDSKKQPAALEGTRTEEERSRQAQLMKRATFVPPTDAVNWENEPPLEASQIAEIEDKIGGGLIEEIIQVAEGEDKLVDVMLESRPWEELEQKPPQGQWDYFARDQHTPGTQEPPKGKN
ncbi:MAG: hypothetical protein Q9222_004149 [Ikaeria aurantiellina]